MEGGNQNHDESSDKGLFSHLAGYAAYPPPHGAYPLQGYPPQRYPSQSYPQVGYPHHDEYPPSGNPPPASSVYPPAGYPPPEPSGYPPSAPPAPSGYPSSAPPAPAGYPPPAPSGYPPSAPGGYPPAVYPGPSTSHHSGHGPSTGALIAGGAAAAAAAYGAHQLSHGAHHRGKFKHGKFKHGKFGKRWKLGKFGKRWKLGKFGGKFMKFKKCKLCIEVTHTSMIAFISEELCIGGDICVKKCPFNAIEIINLPKDLDKDTTHRYGPNTFKLHRLPVPRPGQVLGLVGKNGIGKSTALKVLAGKLKPNLGRFNSPPDWQEILTHVRGSELQSYFTRIVEENLKAIIKPQYVDNLPKSVGGTVGKLLDQNDEKEMKAEVCQELDLNMVVDRDIRDLSGGELQRFAIAVNAVQNADIQIFDEPSSYLDVKQRLKAAKVIRSLLRADRLYMGRKEYMELLLFLFPLEKALMFSWLDLSQQKIYDFAMNHLLSRWLRLHKEIMRRFRHMHIIDTQR